MANLYYTDALPVAGFERGSLIEVTGEEARHAVRVSRLRTGERILVGNGVGAIGDGTVTSTEKERFFVRLEHARHDPPPTRRLLLVQALAKGDRDERAVEQATEFGVDVIVPWEATRSISRWSGAGRGAGEGDKAAKGVARWSRIAREASKQSLRARIPEVRAPASLSDLCRLAADPSTEVIVLHPGGSARLSDWAAARREGTSDDIVIVVGPEGGLADDELQALEGAGAQRRVLGDTVLRTSSAGPAALAVLNAALGRW